MIDAVAHAVLTDALDYIYQQPARTREEHEDASITLRILALLRDGWTGGPKLLDCACGYAMGLSHARYLYKRAERAEFEHLGLLATIPDYDYSLELRVPDQDRMDGRRHFGNRYGSHGMNTEAIKEAAARLGLTKYAIYSRLSAGWTWERAISETRQPPGRNPYGDQFRNLATKAVAGDEPISTCAPNEDDARAGVRPRKRPTPDNRHSSPRLARAPSLTVLPSAYRRRTPPKRISSPAQLKHSRRVAERAYFGA